MTQLLDSDDVRKRFSDDGIPVDVVYLDLSKLLIQYHTTGCLLS